jgi:glucose-1-phosphate cytidylyltransferase
MKVVILAGGLGTRLSEETVVKPKPMVEIGGQPILRHIMNIYEGQGFSQFVIAMGYKKEYITDYFEQHYLDAQIHVDLLDTGQFTQTGGRIKRASEFIGAEPFLLTYGDGVGNIDLRCLLEHHDKQNKLVTVTAVHPPARFGHLIVDEENVTGFLEKSQMDEGWINGGFFVVEPEATKYIADDNTGWEYEALPELAKQGQLTAYKHSGFWQCMDTIHDVETLNNLYNGGNSPWSL